MYMYVMISGWAVRENVQNIEEDTYVLLHKRRVEDMALLNFTYAFSGIARHGRKSKIFFVHGYDNE